MARKAKPTPVHVEETASIWDDLGIPAQNPVFSPTDRTVAPKQTAAASKQDDDRTSAILARLETLERDRSLSSYREPARQEPQYQFDPKTIQFDPTGLPDQTLHPAEYNAALADRVNAVIRANREVVKQEVAMQTERSTAPQRLWDQFRERHPDWAEHKAIVGATAAEVVEDLRQKGIDTQRFVFQESDKFSDMIVEKMTQRGYDKLLDDGANEPEDNRGKAVAKVTPGGRSQVDPDEDEIRTEGIMGGMESGGAPSRGAHVAERVDMISDMKAIQERLFNRSL